jgi:hypothetical protein
MMMIFCSLAIIYVAGRRERQLARLKEDSDPEGTRAGQSLAFFAGVLSSSGTFRNV